MLPPPTPFALAGLHRPSGRKLAGTTPHQSSRRRTRSVHLDKAGRPRASHASRQKGGPHAERLTPSTTTDKEQHWRTPASATPMAAGRYCDLRIADLVRGIGFSTALSLTIAAAA